MEVPGPPPKCSAAGGIYLCSYYLSPPVPGNRPPGTRSNRFPPNSRKEKTGSCFMSVSFLLPSPCPVSRLQQLLHREQIAMCPPPMSPAYLHMSLSSGLQGLLLKWTLPRSTKVNHAFAPEARGPSPYSCLQPLLILSYFTGRAAQPPGPPPSSQTPSPLAQPFQDLHLCTHESPARIPLPNPRFSYSRVC